MSKKFLAFLGFIVLLSFARPIVMPGKSPYLFLLWNLFLAALPYFFVLLKNRISNSGIYQWFLIGLWLLFLPNAPYIITDLVHLDHSMGFDWYDTVLILSAGIAGIKFAFDSLDLMLKDFKQRIPFIPTWAWNFIFLSLSAYGIYLGRYLRFNSWDILTQPLGLLRSCAQLFLHPFQHQQEWSMIVIFAAFLLLLRQIWPKEILEKTED